jgi:transcriptional regulator with XRE-family HTH domain
MYTVMLYLRDLREHSGLTQPDIADAVGVRSKQVYRWEAGQNVPGFPKLLVFAREVKASLDHVASLLLLDDDDIVSQRVARELARDRWEELQAGSHASTQDEQTRHLCEVIDRLRADPDRLNRVIGYADRLLDEMNGTV